MNPLPPWATRVLVGTLAVPALFGALVLWSFGDRDDRIEQVPAAVVNLDQPVEQGKGKDAEVVYGGRLLAAELTSPAREEDRTLGWELTETEKALTGLQEGDYHAVVVIPEDFSSTLAGIAGRDPDAAEIVVRSNDATSPLVAQVSDQIGTIASARLGRFVTARYLEGVFAETGGLARRLGTASDAAGRIAGGAGELNQGAARAGGGAQELATGIGRLNEGAGRLSAGAGELADGAGALAGGADELAGGAARIDEGAEQLAQGLDRLSRRTRTLPQDFRALADGAGQVADGVDVYADLVAGWADACRTRPLTAAQHPRLCVISTRAAGEEGQQAAQLEAGARQVADGTRELAEAAPELRDGIGRLGGGSRDLAEGTGELAAGASRLATGGRELAGGARDLAEGASELAAGAGAAGTGAQELAAGVGRLRDGAGRLEGGSTRLADGLADGAGQVPGRDPDEAGAMADVVSQPVRSASDRLGEPVDLRTSLTPAALALALWLGAFVIFLVRPALPQELAERAGPAYRVVLGGLWPALVLAVGQAVLLVSVALVLGASPRSGLSGYAGLVAAVLLGVVVFTAVNQAFVAVSGPRRGWIALIVLSIVQVVTLGGLVPVETAPAPLAALDGLLPVSALARLLDRTLVTGAPGGVGGSVAVLVLCGVVAAAVCVVAARRRQQVRVRDLRRDLPVPLAGAPRG